MQTIKRDPSLRVDQLLDYQFVSDNQDTAPLIEQFPASKDYSGFFVSKKDLEHGEITHVYAIHRSIPYLNDLAYLFEQELSILDIAERNCNFGKSDF